jgi:hypothetical protein
LGLSTFPARLAAGNMVAASVAQMQTALAIRSTTLSDGKFWIGNIANTAAERTMNGHATMDDTGLITIANGVVKPNMLTQYVESGRNTGVMAVKYLDGVTLKALLDSTTKTLFSMSNKDTILSIMVVVQTVHGAPGTIDVGLDVALRTAGADTDGLLKTANAALKGKYSSDVSAFSGAELDFGQFSCQGDGNITITSSVDMTGGTFIGYAMVSYLPA